MASGSSSPEDYRSSEGEEIARIAPSLEGQSRGRCGCLGGSLDFGQPEWWTWAIGRPRESHVAVNFVSCPAGRTPGPDRMSPEAWSRRSVPEIRKRGGVYLGRRLSNAARTAGHGSVALARSRSFVFDGTAGRSVLGSSRAPNRESRDSGSRSGQRIPACRATASFGSSLASRG